MPKTRPTQSITVRPMILDDIPELAELYRQFWGQSSSISNMKELFERLLTRDDYCFLSAMEETKSEPCNSLIDFLEHDADLSVEYDRKELTA